MNGATLSRWTLAYFACGLISLLLALVLMVCGLGFPSQTIEDPHTLVLVHLVVVGWLSFLMLGALLQFLPVLVSRPLAFPCLPGPALALMVAGLSSLLLGFCSLAGVPLGPLPWLPIGGIGLVLGFGLNVLNLFQTICLAKTRPLSVQFVIAGLVAFLGTIALGLTFTFVLQGWATLPYFSALLADGLILHVALGLGGWLTFTAMGVSYRLLCMFMLSPEKERRTTVVSFWLGVTAIATVLVAAPIIIGMAAHFAAAPLVAAMLLSVTCISLYGWDVIDIFRKRNRRHLELNSRMAKWALWALAIGVLATLGFACTGWRTQTVGTVAFIFGLGWLTGLGLSKAYKIVAFMTWLETYGPILGKRPVPQVSNMVDEGKALIWFKGLYIGLLAGAVAILLGQISLFRVTALVDFLCVAKITIELLRIRSLKYASTHKNQPADIRRPKFFLVKSSR